METKNIASTLEDETKFLIEIADKFGKDAQNILDFVAKTGNLEKATKVLRKPEVTNRRPTSEITRSNETPLDVFYYVSDNLPSCKITGSNTDLPDGIYFIAENHTNYQLMTDNDPMPNFSVKYIGVKMGQRAIAVALKDLPGDNDGKLQLLPDNHTSPKTSDYYSYNNKTDKFMFNVLEDFNGQANTNRLKEYGCTIDIPEGEWIPSIGELSLLMMHTSKVNKAIELAGGEPIKGGHLSSTEYNEFNTWCVYFEDGHAYISVKCSSNTIRTVTTF